ncbi:phospholipase A2 [Episyrphus balteatus]|uniref:phospholipase A2 n=1 Tax=Episyrphus balteatus TaxID=286459 RepID=UPI002485B3B8|nr:phospholipase A2 [Episyrphus balteatus]
MKTCLKYFLLIMLNLLIVAAFQDEAIFEDEDIYNRALPPLPYSGMTVPGTKWCGPGNTSANYDDLGRFRETDKCCRAHDHCPDTIESGSTKYSLFNPDMFPRMKCECEQEFLNCLQNANDMAASTVGRAYFSARSICFKYTFPMLRCTEYMEGTFSRRCVKYKFNINKPFKWQFFDVPYYTAKK